MLLSKFRSGCRVTALAGVVCLVLCMGCGNELPVTPTAGPLELVSWFGRPQLAGDWFTSIVGMGVSDVGTIRLVLRNAHVFGVHSYELIEINSAGTPISRRVLPGELEIYSVQFVGDVAYARTDAGFLIIDSSGIRVTPLSVEGGIEIRVDPQGVIHYWERESAIMHRLDASGRTLEPLRTPSALDSWREAAFSEGYSAFLHTSLGRYGAVLTLQRGPNTWRVSQSSGGKMRVDERGIVYFFGYGRRIEAIDVRNGERRTIAIDSVGEPPGSRYVALDPAGGFVVADEKSVWRISNEGRVTWRGGETTDPAWLDDARSLTVDLHGRVYVGDSHGVMVYTAEGFRIGRWPDRRGDAYRDLTALQNGVLVGRNHRSEVKIYQADGELLRTLDSTVLQITSEFDVLRAQGDHVLMLSRRSGRVAAFSMRDGSIAHWRCLEAGEVYLGSAVDGTGALAVDVSRQVPEGGDRRYLMKRFTPAGQLIDIVEHAGGWTLLRGTYDGRLLFMREFRGEEYLAVLDVASGVSEDIRLPDPVVDLRDATIGPFGDLYVLDAYHHAVLRLR